MHTSLSDFSRLKNYFSDLTISIGTGFIPIHKVDPESYYQVTLQRLQDKIDRKLLSDEPVSKETCVLINGLHYLDDFAVMRSYFDEFKIELINNVSSRSLKKEIPKYIEELIVYFKKLFNGFKQNQETDKRGKIITYYTYDDFNNEYLKSEKYKESFRDEISYYLQIKMEYIRNILDKILEIQENPEFYLIKSTEKEFKSPIIWKKGPTPLVELVVSLFESKSITNQTEDLKISEAYKAFESIFNIELKQPDSLLSHHKEVINDPAPFLTKLREAYLTYIDKH